MIIYKRTILGKKFRKKKGLNYINLTDLCIITKLHYFISK